jgi:hypothetical protein
VDNVTLTVVDIDPPGNVVYGFQAFAGSTNLGIFSIPPHSQGIETKNITMLAGGALLSKITLVVTQSAPAGLQIQQTSFTVVPEPANLALVGLSATILRRRTR